MRVLLFTNLYPCESDPLHGCFVRERTERLAALTGFDYVVVRPRPALPGPLGLITTPHHRIETHEGRVIHHVSYPHLPLVGWTRQDQRMVSGLRGVFTSIVSEYGPDLVDAQYLYPDGLAAIQLSRGAGIPCLATARGTDVNVMAFEPRLRARFESGLREATGVAAVSPALAGILEREFGLDHVHVTPNGVDLDDFQPMALDATPARRLISVGRLVAGKALDYLIEALALEPLLPQLELVGSGPEEKRLRRLAKRRGVAGRVTFRGSMGREVLARELSRGGVFAFPTRREGWPNAVLEALACGLPVCASATGGIPDMLGATGNLVPLEAGPGEWARSLRRLWQSYEEDPRGLGAQARERAEMFSWDHSMDRCIAFYEEALR